MTPEGHEAPVRLCCGRRHRGPVCPDGKVMCCVCFERKSQADLNVLDAGQKEDVCKACVEEEKLLERRSPRFLVIDEPHEDEPQRETVLGPPTESYQESADRFHWETIGGTRRHPYED